MSSWQNHYFQRGVSHGDEDGLERSFFYALHTSGGRSTSGCVLWILWCISPVPAPASPFAAWLSMGWSVLVSVLGTFSVPGPATCTKMIFVSTLVSYFAPCWAFSQWMRCAAYAACLTWATLGSVAITFFKLKHLDIINCCCCCNSSIGSVSVEVFYCHLVLLGMLQKGYVCDNLSLLLWSDPLFGSFGIHAN